MSIVHAAIAARCPAPEWATFFEVRNDAGFGANRSADAVAMNLWPSRGLEIHGFEVKTERADFLRELKDPAKAEAVQQFCDRWWVAVSSDKIAKPEEMPPTWGLLVLRGAKLVQVKEAPRLTPLPPSLGFIAAMFRRATEGSTPKNLVAEEVAAKVAAVVEKKTSRLEIDHQYAQEELQRIKQVVFDFERSSGIKIDAGKWSHGHDPARVGAAVAAVLSGELSGRISGLEQARNVAHAFIRDSEAALEALRAIAEPKPVGT